MFLVDFVHFVDFNKYVRPLVSHAEYALTGQADGRTHGRQTVTLHFPLDAASVKNKHTDGLL